MSHAGHGKVVYSCGHVRAQCRCMDAGKTVETLDYPCGACAAKQGAGTTSPAAQTPDEAEAEMKAAEWQLAHELLYAVKDVGMLDKRGRLLAWRDAIEHVKAMHMRLDVLGRAVDVDLVFDGVPGPEGPRFIEAERAGDGTSVSVGTWRQEGTLGKLRVKVVLP